MSQITVHDFLNRLDNVKETRKGQWMANCPAHGGTNRKLAIAEGNPQPKVNCLSQGCTKEEVYDAVGVHWSDFYPEKPSTQFGAVDNPKFVMTREMIDGMRHRLTMCIIAMADIMAGKELSDEDKADVLAALHDFQELMDAAR
jgi:hypothetical protein